jgi:prepilin-type N-terminal cleavage/methylation domain-containing protein
MRRRAFSLIEILVVIVIIAILAAVLMPRYLSGGVTAGGKKIDSPKQKAQGVECQNNLSQIRLALQTAGISDEEHPPQNLTELRLPTSMLTCPVGKTPYQYDPRQKKVWCTYSNHASW